MGVVLKFMDFCELFPLNIRLPESKGAVYIKTSSTWSKNIYPILSFQRIKMHNKQVVLLCIFILSIFNFRSGYTPLFCLKKSVFKIYQHRQLLEELINLKLFYYNLYII